MSFLFPLYLLGLGALIVPLILHFRSRNPKNLMDFSSLMFLEPSPVREKTKSKLQHLLLLLLRCLILALLALAFCRPFLKRLVDRESLDATNHVSVLIDRSASMKRQDLWAQALDEASSAIRGLGDRDYLQILAFDEGVDQVLTFEEWDELPLGQRGELVLEKVRALEPNWQATDLGNAMISAVETDDERLEVDVKNRRLVVISDFQKGAESEVLKNYRWPADTDFDFRSVKSGDKGNASIQVLPDPNAILGLGKTERRVRVTNSKDSETSNFNLVWRSIDGSVASQQTSVSVPVGESKVFLAPATLTGLPAPILELSGDGPDYDNRFYMSAPPPRTLRILYYGTDGETDPNGSLLFLKSALVETKTLRPEVIIRRPEESLEGLDLKEFFLVVLDDPKDSSNVDLLANYIAEGGRCLFLMHSPDSAAALTKILGLTTTIPVEEKKADNYFLLGKMARQHPLLKPFAEARLGNFSKIHYWRYQALDPSLLGKHEVIAHFETDDPAWVDISRNQGRVLLMTSGWRSEDSQLALSTKFVPLLYAAISLSAEDVIESPLLFVGNSIVNDNDFTVALETPSKERVNLEAGRGFSDTDEPGIYRLITPDKTRDVAINLPTSESLTAPLDLEALKESFNSKDKVSVEEGEVKEEELKRVLTSEELEARQRSWRWLIFAALFFIFVEIFYAAHCARKEYQPQS